MKKILSIIVFTGLFLPSLHAQQVTRDTLRMSLEDCLQYAVSNNYNRQSVKLNEESRKIIYEQSKLERLPDLNATVSENLNHTKGSSANWNGSYGISTNVNIFQGGNINETIRQNELSQEVAEYQTSQYDNTLTIQVLESFLTALGNEELLKYQQSVLTYSEEQVNQGKELFRVGQILESDYYLLEAQYATDRSNIIESTINRDNSLAALKALLSIDPQQPMALIYPDTAMISNLLILPPYDNVLERTLNSLPDMQISNYNVEIAESGLKIVRSAFYPSLTLRGSIGTGHSRNFKNYGDQLSNQLNEQVGVTLSIPIFNRNRTKANVAQSRIALEQAELEQKQTELDIRQTILQEYRNVQNAGNKYQSSDTRQNAYFKSFEAYRARFNAGSITTVDLLQQQNNYINAMNEYIRNKYSFILQRKVLDVYMGERISM